MAENQQGHGLNTSIFHIKHACPPTRDLSERHLATGVPLSLLAGEGRHGRDGRTALGHLLARAGPDELRETGRGGRSGAATEAAAQHHPSRGHRQLASQEEGDGEEEGEAEGEGKGKREGMISPLPH